MKPNTPETRGIGTSVETPNTQRGTEPTANKAAAQVKPIPIAPRMRRSHFPIIASGPGPSAHLLSLYLQSRCQVLCTAKYQSVRRDSRALIAGPRARDKSRARVAIAARATPD